MSEYKIDGFRYDFTKGFSNTPYGENDWANGPDNARIANLKRMSAAVQKRQPGAYVIFEHLAATSEERQLGDAGILLWCNKMKHIVKQLWDGVVQKPIFLVYMREQVCLPVV